MKNTKFALASIIGCCLLSFERVDAAYGFEFEMHSYVRTFVGDKEIRLTARQDLYRTSPTWVLRTDDQTKQHRTFEFITEVFDTKEGEGEMLRSFREIREHAEFLTSLFWNALAGKKPERLNWNEAYRPKIARLQATPAGHTAARSLIENCLYDAPQKYGMDQSLMVSWEPKGFAASKINYALPYAYAFSQTTFGVYPDKFFTAIKMLSQVKGSVMDEEEPKNFIRIAENSFEKYMVDDPAAKSFLYMIMAHISSARFCNLPNQWQRDVMGYFRNNFAGAHSALYDYAKQATNLHGFLARTDFVTMFQSLPDETQTYLRGSIWMILADMLRDCGGAQLFDQHLYRYGFAADKTAIWELGIMDRMRATAGDLQFVRYGPIIGDWIEAILDEKGDLLNWPPDFESMSQMGLEAGGKWIIELRRGPRDMIVIPREDSKGQLVGARMFGFANVYATYKLLDYVNEQPHGRLNDILKRDRTSSFYDNLVMDGVRKLNVNARALEAAVDQCVPNHQTEIRKHFLLRHL